MLKTRIASAVVFAPALVAIIWYANDVGFAVFVGLLVAIGGFEWARLAGVEQRPWQLIFALIAGLLGSAASALQSATAWWLTTAILLWAINAAWLARHRFGAEPNLANCATKLLVGMAVLVLACVAFNKLHAGANGAVLTLFLFVIIWAADIGAYFAGRGLGRHKLAPSISPAKTWEGVAGGQLAVLAVVAVVDQTAPAGLEIDLWWYLIAIATAAISVVGDLFVSLLKRQAELKDTGRLIPGHGGILDRFDSAFAAAPLFAGALALL